MEFCVVVGIFIQGPALNRPDRTALRTANKTSMLLFEMRSQASSANESSSTAMARASEVVRVILESCGEY